MTALPPILADIWSDYVCPYCYLQLPDIERLQAAFGERLRVTWRAFELRPEPNPTLDPAGDYLRTAWEHSVIPMSIERGMALALPPVQPRSLAAHEAAQFAAAHGRFGAMHRALFQAFFEYGRDIGDSAVLLDIAAGEGLDPDALRAALDTQQFRPKVLDDERLARDLCVNGVPVMLLRRGEAPWREAVQVQGAVPYESMHTAVARLVDPSAQ